MNKTMTTVIHSNGSKWAGESPDEDAIKKLPTLYKRDPIKKLSEQQQVRLEGRD